MNPSYPNPVPPLLVLEDNRG